jgi:hypothetical protein
VAASRIVPELEQIGKEGFPRLKMHVNDAFIAGLAVESCGSPQLMQSLCLQTCYRLDVYESLSKTRTFDLGDGDLRKVTETTSTMADFSTVVEAMHAGPKLRGQERKEYTFVDGTQGDVYRAVLLAVASDPPTMSLSYSELMERVVAVCTDKSPYALTRCPSDQALARPVAKFTKSPRNRSRAKLECRGCRQSNGIRRQL